MNEPVLRLPRQDDRWSETVTNRDGRSTNRRPRDPRACSVSLEETEQAGTWEAGGSRPAIRQERVSDELTISGRRVIVPKRAAVGEAQVALRDAATCAFRERCSSEPTPEPENSRQTPSARRLPTGSVSGQTRFRCPTEGSPCGCPPAAMHQGGADENRDKATSVR